ncbi:DarT ssDNA thymidine ADP-ribosyltransferase family protein [Methanimicrococcus hacksteinii]|nr:DarT ssDNA thymidine ADP-ribosyltransferase family protein [Methanimicrococcus sp. At1]
MTANIKNQKLLYHLTDADNFESIVSNGLQSRKSCRNISFKDVADQEIISFREEAGLDEYVPFHFFAQNPFDGRVQKKYPDSEFIYISIRRDLAQHYNFQIIPQHPLSMDPFKMYDYNEGMDIIDWNAMNSRDYHDPYIKNVCMAECVGKYIIPAKTFHCVWVRTNKSKSYVTDVLIKHNIDNVYVNHNPSMFVKRGV